MGLLAGRPHARLCDLRLRRARGAPPGRPRFRRGRAAPGPARCTRRPACHERAVHARRLGRLAFRRARPAGPGDRSRARRRERRAPRPASAARSLRRRADQRRGERGRHRPWCSRLGDARSAAAGSARAALRRAVRPLRHRLHRRAAHAGAGRGPLASAPDAAAPERSPRRAAAVPPRRARRAFVVVGRRPVPLARSAAVGDSVRYDQPHRDRHKHLRPRGLRLGGAAPFRPARAVGRSGGRVGGARRRDGDHRGRCLDRFGRPAPRRLSRWRGGLRPRVPRRTARAVGRDPTGPPRSRHVGLLRRRLHVAVDPGGARRNRRNPAGARIDVRDPRKRRRGARAGRRRRGLAHASAGRAARTRALRRDSNRAPPPSRDAPRRSRVRPPARVGRPAGAGRGCTRAR